MDHRVKKLRKLHSNIEDYLDSLLLLQSMVDYTLISMSNKFKNTKELQKLIDFMKSDTLIIKLQDSGIKDAIRDVLGHCVGDPDD